MEWRKPVRVAAAWTRPYTSVQAAWVRALDVFPSASWREGAASARRAAPSASDVRECFENRRRVDMRDRS